jgi:hypothetical protein
VPTRCYVHHAAGMGIVLQEYNPASAAELATATLQVFSNASALHPRLCDVRVGVRVEGKCFCATMREAVDPPVTCGCDVRRGGWRSSRSRAYELRAALRGDRQCTREGEQWERMSEYGGWAVCSGLGRSRVSSDWYASCCRWHSPLVTVRHEGRVAGCWRGGRGLY